MSELKIAGNPLPGMPWEERPEGCKNVMWRCSANPIIPRDLLPTSNSIFNSAVVPFGDGFAGVFRCDDTNRRMRPDGASCGIQQGCRSLGHQSGEVAVPV